MEGMKRANDCHHWVRYATSSVQGFLGDVRVSTCGGGFQCKNPTCNYFLTNQKPNVNHFVGRLNKRCPLGLLATESGTMKCRYCSHPPFCVKQCSTRIYYCIPFDTRYSRMVIHIGNHEHDYGVGVSSVFLAEAESLVKQKSISVSNLGPKGVQKSLVKDLISMHLLSGSEAQCEMSVSKLDELLSLVEPTTNNRRYIDHVIT